MSTEWILNPILKRIAEHFGSIYEDNICTDYSIKVSQGLKKGWWSYATKKECEAKRQELIIESIKKDKIPQLKERLQYVMGSLLSEAHSSNYLIVLCHYYLKKLEKIEKKKNLAYKDAIKVDDLFSEIPADLKLKGFKMDISPDVILGYVGRNISNVKFRNELKKILETYNLLGELK